MYHTSFQEKFSTSYLLEKQGTSRRKVLNLFKMILNNQGDHWDKGDCFIIIKESYRTYSILKQINGRAPFLEVWYILPALAPKILLLVDIIDCTVHFVISYE